MRATLLSVCVGMPRVVEDAEGIWETGFWKEPVEGPLWLGELGLPGDGHVSSVHGGPDKALLAYPAGHYPRWRAELDLPEMGYGGFGENMVWSAGDETSVCIGDIFQVGLARVQVSEARIPCWKISRRWGIDELLKRVLETGRFGWHLRVLDEGAVQAGDRVSLLERPYPTWTVARALQTYQSRGAQPEAARELATVEPLSAVWKQKLAG